MPEETSNKTKIPVIYQKLIKVFGYILAVFIVFCICRSVFISIFISPAAINSQDSQILDDNSLNACNQEWKRLREELESEFQRNFTKSYDLKLAKSTWNEWHRKWYNRLEAQQKNCLVSTTQNQFEQNDSLVAIDKGYQDIMSIYLKRILPELIKK